LAKYSSKEINFPYSVALNLLHILLVKLPSVGLAWFIRWAELSHTPTARVTRVARDWYVVLLSASIFSDTMLITFINIAGYAIASNLNRITGRLREKSHPRKPSDVEASTEKTS
ncbi:hypothetical protein EJB05_09963, partial [Eragrostis curvula]